MPFIFNKLVKDLKPESSFPHHHTKRSSSTTIYGKRIFVRWFWQLFLKYFHAIFFSSFAPYAPLHETPLLRHPSSTYVPLSNLSSYVKPIIPIRLCVLPSFIVPANPPILYSVPNSSNAVVKLPCASRHHSPNWDFFYNVFI